MKILFISHNASLSGAPLVLLNLLKWIQQHQPEFTADILFLEGGDYLDEFRQCVHQVFLPADLHQEKEKKSFLKRLKKKFFSPRPGNTPRRFRVNDYRFIYANTVLALPIGENLKQLNPSAKLLLHLHELDTVIRILDAGFHDRIDKVDVFIGVSRSVCDNLLQQYGIPQNKIRLVYEFINAPQQESLPAPNNQAKPFKIGASGFIDWRKGYEIFILVAAKIKKTYPDLDLVFEWVGDVSRETAIVIDNDLKKLALQDTVFFSGKTRQPLAKFREFDILLLPSREDPFPLVCLEAGLLGKPVICFEKAGGIPELLEDGGGRVVPYLDIDAMAEAVKFYHDHPEIRQADGNRLKEKAAQYDTRVLAPQIVSLFR
jgi:glycosyltransferase involved in cell wall biosynthesis